MTLAEQAIANLIVWLDTHSLPLQQAKPLEESIKVLEDSKAIREAINTWRKTHDIHLLLSEDQLKQTRGPCGITADYNQTPTKETLLNALRRSCPALASQPAQAPSAQQDKPHDTKKS